MDVDANIDLRSLDLAHSLALTELIRFALGKSHRTMTAAHFEIAFGRLKKGS